ncbi:hypothetical protein M409DRAFT_35309 [Zasmidium cellare ATCC 36951]|uniref:aspartate transaminase n=1 Tax=Zasmidium cellare ATCC 36951 TaxID=1080233 RepID=A0A6A6D6Z7_ZASCE|nr:uncharacterized protein M409DRAFT_35309 [Zasmidium cellare ATCC 36951]KAF2174012.1 hypothetical protein M409DRAFT_35309 [Zasmidium cellare ATCC 36951]
MATNSEQDVLNSGTTPYSANGRQDSESPLASVPMAPKDPMFGLSAAFRADTDPKKVDLGVGAYRDDNAKPWVLSVVKKADEILRQTPDLNHEYLPIAGLNEYLAASQQLVFGKDSQILHNHRVATMQTISGTGALHLGARFLSKFFPESDAKRVHVSSPPYVNHLPILHDACLETAFYPYYTPTTKSLDCDALLATLHAIPEHSIVLLHACAHNPTGVDPTQSQWRQIASVMRERQHLPFFDSAYQGFASGDLDADAWAIRHFVSLDFPALLVAQSYAKNFGLYGERTGCLHVVAQDADLAARIKSQMEKLQRVNISTPPAYGARIASTVLSSPALFSEWQEDLRTMSGRIVEMRRALRALLEKGKGEEGKWKHLTEQTGMFCYTGLDPEQVRVLREKWHVYLTGDGRVSVSGLNWGNVRYVAEAFGAVEGMGKADKARM